MSTRRSLVGVLALLTAALACAVWASAAEQPGAARVLGVESIGLNVSDLDRSVRFFHDVLDFEKISQVEIAGDAFERLQGLFGLRLRRAVMRLGSESIELTQYLAPEGRPFPVDSASNDRSFQHLAIVVRDMQAAYARLREHGVRHASSGPQRLPDWNPDAGGIEAFYFKDPDGHALELIRFPPGKGDPRWRRETDRLFLGIDHTAIVVEDTEASLAVYREALGLRVAGESENYGTEQEHLNNVFGARLRITALRATAGPGIELLEYLAPRTGRPYPGDTRSSDLWNWETRLTVADPDAAIGVVREAGGVWVSPGVVSLPDGSLGFGRGGLVRDRDGHALLLVAR